MDLTPRQRAYQAIGTFLTFRRVSSIHRWLYRATRGRGPVGHALGVPMILLTTMGCRTGEARTNPLVAVPDGDDWLVVGSNGGRERAPGWVHNLRASPRATATYREDSAEVLARETAGEERDRRWEQVVAAYPGYAEYARITSRPIPVFVLEPRERTTSRTRFSSSSAQAERPTRSENPLERTPSPAEGRP